jgi:hypothetical protein
VSLKRINAAIAKISPHCELVKGGGYHYFQYDDQDAGIYETESVMVAYTSDHSTDRWLSEAADFINICKRK